MADLPRGMLLSKAAFELADAGRLEEAADKYAEAVQELDPSHYWSPSNHSEFAWVLSRLGRADEAVREYEIALQQEEILYAPEALASPVVVARYFLAEHLLRTGQPQRALTTVVSVLGSGVRLEARAHFISALALHSLGQVAEAREAAVRALELAGSEATRASWREQLAGIVQSSEGGAGEQGDEADVAPGEAWRRGTS